MALLRGNKGSRKLIEEGESKLAFLRRIDDPPLTGWEGRTSHDICASRIDPPLTGGSVCHIAFLRLRFGSRKLIEEGEKRLALLRRNDDPPLTGGSACFVALMRTYGGSHN